MMRTFAPLSDGDLPVPAELLDSLVDTLGTDDNWVVIGAAARDIALALGCVALPRRATNDIDIAVAAHADHVTLPSGRILPVAPLELIAVLKLMAFADRYPAQTKDADDLLIVMRASSHGVYGEEVWDDDRAMSAPDFDQELAGAYRLGRRGVHCFSHDRAQRVLDVAAKTQAALRLAWHGTHQDLMDAWLAGLRSGDSAEASR